MIHRIVQFALQQRFLVLMLTALMIVAGAWSFRQMPVDAYPDLSPPMVELITQWPGHAAEEVERLTTLPLELAMNGSPRLKIMRSISLYGLSDVILTFDDGVDPYFAREVVFERISDAVLPQGVTPSMAPLFSPSGLVYRYVIESPDRSPMELHTFEDWTIERAYKSVPGVADDSGFGGPTMEYHVLLDPVKLYNYHLPVVQVVAALNANNANTGGGFYSQGGQFYYVRGLGLVKTTEDIGEVVVASLNGVPVRIKDIGRVEIGHAPRLGIFGFQTKQKNDDDAVEGVILMRRGEQTQNVLEGVEKKTDEINKTLLPPDVKIRPYYDRSDLVRVTTDTVEGNLLARNGSGFPRPDLFPGQFPRGRDHRSDDSAGSALRLHLPALDGRSCQSSLHRRNRFRHHHRRHCRYGREHLSRARPSLRSGLQTHRCRFSPRRRDVDRPIFYSVAVIIAGYLPIYALSGPAGKLFHPMADTMGFALLGALILTLTVVPVLAAYWFKSGVREKENRVYEWFKREYGSELKWCLEHPKLTMLLATLIFALSLLLVPFIGGEFMPHLDEGAIWVRATMPYTISFEEAAKFAPQIRDLLSKYPQVTVLGSELGRPDDGTDPTGFFNCEFYVGLKPYGDKSWKSGSIHSKEELTRAFQKELEAYPGVIFNYTQPAEDAVDEALTGLKSALAVKIFGPDLSVLEKKAVEIKNVLDKTPGLHGTYRCARARPA